MIEINIEVLLLFKTIFINWWLRSFEFIYVDMFKAFNNFKQWAIYYVLIKNDNNYWWQQSFLLLNYLHCLKYLNNIVIIIVTLYCDKYL